MADSGRSTRPQVHALIFGSFKLLLEVRILPQVFFQNFLGRVFVKPILGVFFFIDHSFVFTPHQAFLGNRAADTAPLPTLL